MIKQIFGLCLLTSCATHEDHRVKSEWDERLKPYIQEYIDDVKKYDLPTPEIGLINIIKIDTETLRKYDPNGDLWGVCVMKEYYGRRQTREIYIEDDLGEDYTKRLLYHEITHCGFNIKEHFGEEGDIFYESADDTIPFEEAKERLFNSLIAYFKEKEG